jgi:5-methylcytosine-specific restriction enzyme B
MIDKRVPVFQDFMNPILTALRELGGKAALRTLDERVLADMKLAAEVLSIPHKPDDPERTEAAYRAAWARSYLKAAGLLTNPSRGLWALTEKGKATPAVDPRLIIAENAKVRAERGEADQLEAKTEDDTEETSGLDPRIRSDILERFDKLLSQGLVLRAEQASACYLRFRERFGPEVLASLDGERLLTTMHARSTRDSLVYWLEFKDDEEFPARFGSIAGGSALKFGIYQSAENGQWWTGNAQNQVPLALPDAISKGRQQRDELLRGVAVLQDFIKAGSSDYAALQSRILEAAPSVAETAWGHKYFSLLYPEHLDDYHASDYQRHHLLKLLRAPARGRYANAGLFVSAARELGITPNQLGTVLNHRDGSPHEYWRVGTKWDEGDEWPRMRDGGFAAIGWPLLGALSDVPATREGKESLRARMASLYPTNAGAVTRNNQQVFNFAVNAHERDIIVAMAGQTVRGIGVVTGGYHYQEGDGPFPHRRPVEWRDVSEWRLPVAEAMLSTFRPLGKHDSNLLAIERMLLDGPGAPRPAARTPTHHPSAVRTPATLGGISARIHNALQRKRQVILYGPPGTGKTHWANTTVQELVARSWFGSAHAELTPAELDQIKRGGALSACTFHPGYGYEDFIEGYRPVKTTTGLSFELKPGVFHALCERARTDPNRDYFMLIDEINRGDVPRIFGELLTLLEHDKRGKELTLPLSQQPFSVPKNVFVVGTMNTADRSIALLDAALRRRFAFIELMPDASALGNSAVGDLPLGPWLRELNRRIVANVGRDARNLQIGHAYLMQGERPISEPARFLEVFRDDIVPLLEEYCYEDFDALGKILSTAIVRRESQGAAPGFVEFADPKALIEALLQGFENLATAPEAVERDGAALDDEEDPDDSEPSNET